MRENFPVQQTGLKIRSFIRQKIRRHFSIPQIENSALLLLDLQNFFFHHKEPGFIPSTPQLISPLNELVSLFEQKGQPIIYTRHYSVKDSLMNQWWKHQLKRDSRGFQLYFEHSREGLIFEKCEYDSFSNPLLAEFLRSEKITRLYVGGVTTHLCCETTIRSAFVQGFQPYLLIDATTTFNRLFYQSSLLNIAHGFAELLTSSELISFNG